MAQNITLLGASYSDVPSVTLPKTGGGTASFTDVTDTTAIASDVAQGKYFYLADGTKTEGTSTGGGGYYLELNHLKAQSTTNSGKWNFGVDNVRWDEGDYIEVEFLDDTNHSVSKPEVFSVGTNITSWTERKCIFVYLSYADSPSDGTHPIVKVHQNAVDTLTGMIDPDIPHKIKIDKDYVYLDGTAIVGVVSTVSTNYSPDIGACEGSGRFYGKYNYIRVIKGGTS